MRDVTRVGRPLGAEQYLAHDRVHAVGAHHDAGLGGGPVGEAQQHRIVALLEPDQPLAERDGTGLDRAQQLRVIVATMQDQVRRAEVPLGRVAKREVAGNLAASRIAAAK
jgi:hypothetical protein